MATTKTDVRWLNPREMKAWRNYIIASRRMLEALDRNIEAMRPVVQINLLQPYAVSLLSFNILPE